MPLLTPPSVRLLLDKMDQKENNIYFKLCKQGTSNPYSRYYIFHSLNPLTANPTHLTIQIGKNMVVAARINSAHKIIPLYRTFMNANPKQEWLQFENHTDLFILVPKISAETHAKVMNLFISASKNQEKSHSDSVSNTYHSASNGRPQLLLDDSTSRRENNMPLLPTHCDVGPK